MAMGRALIFLFFWVSIFGFTSNTTGQVCNSQRYKEQVFPGVQVLSDLKFGAANPYGLLQNQDLYMDIYFPIGDTLTQRPLIVYAFGGGFLIGFRSQPPIPDYCTHFAKMGYVVAAIDYRTGFNTVSTGSAERAVYRGVQDLRAALRYLAHFRVPLGIDTGKIFLTGSSAGCFSALHSSFMEETDRPASTYGIFLEPSDLGCGDCSGNTYFNNQEVRVHGVINHWGAILDTLFIDPVPKDNIPVISFHGTNDLIVPYGTGRPFSYPIFPVVQGSEPLHKRLSNLNIKNELHTWQGIGHEPWLTDSRWLDTAYFYTTPFLYDILKPQASAIFGKDSVCVGDVQTYYVTPGRSGSTFCWSVTNGIILQHNGPSITVEWTSAGAGQIYLIEMTKNDVPGNEQNLSILVADPSRASFSFQVANGLATFYNASQNASAFFWTFGDGTGSTDPNPVHQYADTGLYQVTLVADNGICPDTAVKMLQVPLCSQPAFVKAHRITPNSVRISWMPVTGANGYFVWITAGQSGLWNSFYLNQPADSFLQLNSLHKGLTYYFKVQTECVFPPEANSAFSPIDSFVPQCMTPLNPHPAIIQRTSVRLAWERVFGCAGYSIQGRQFGGGPVQTLLVAGSANTTKDIYGLSPNTAYEFRVRTWCDAQGAEKSPWSPWVSFLTNPRLENPEESIGMEDNPRFSLFPNPSSGKVVLINRGDESGPLTVEVFQVSGKKVFSNVFDSLLSENLELDLSSHPTGLYFVSVRTENTSSILRLVKQ